MVELLGEFSRAAIETYTTCEVGNSKGDLSDGNLN